MKHRQWIARTAVFHLLAAIMSCGLTAAAAGSLTARAGETTVTVGPTVTVTLTYDGGGAGIGAIDAQLQYNAAAFQYEKASGASANGGAGIVRLSWYAEGAQAPTSVTMQVTFKAIGPGEGGFAVSTDSFYDDDDKTLGLPAQLLSVSAINPTLSGNADLASLKPSSGTLTPKFSAGTTEYTVTVPYTTTSLTLSATAADSGAKVSVSGTAALQVGKNTRTVTVTAPNGNTKKYTVVITRSENQTDGSSASTTTVVTPPADALEVSVDGKLMTVADTQPDTELPAGFRWDYTTVNQVTVPAAKSDSSGLVLLWLLDATAPDEAGNATGSFYIYSAEGGEFSAFRPVNAPGGLYALLAMPAGLEAPAGTVAGKCSIGGAEFDAWVYEDTAQADFSVLYAIAPNGKTGLYVYDASDGSFQRYRELAASAAALQPPQDDTPHGFSAFVTAHRTVLLLCAAVLSGLALLVGAIVLLIALLRRPPRNCKH